MSGLRFAGGVVVLAMVSSPVFAQQAPAWYAGISSGVTYMNPSEISGGNGGKLGYDQGFNSDVAFGYAPNGSLQPFADMRIEFEFGYHSNPTNRYTPSLGAAAGTPGSVQSISYMGNAFYDFHNYSAWTPYVGAGAGIATVKLAKAIGTGARGSDSNAFAYQFMGGVYYTDPTLPKMDWSLGYRYYDISDPRFRYDGGKIKVNNLTTQDVELGARYRF